jgi:cyclic-di-GMP-binding protein
MIAGELQPAFLNADQCRQWLATTPLGNAVQALSHLLRQLNLLNRCNIQPDERLAILEVLRKPILQAQEEGAKRFLGKPLPLVPPEQAAFDSAQAVWQSLLKGYGRCIEVEMAHAASGSPMLALLFQRALATLTAAQIDIYRAGFEPSPEHWLALHKLYAAAEGAGIADTEVEDAVRQGKTPSTPRAAYAEVMLLHATSPHELSARHLAWVVRWSRRWSLKVRVVGATPALDGETVPLNIDLAAGRAAGYRLVDGPNARWLDTSEVKRSIKKRLSMLEKGVQPAEIQLGEDCTQPACGQVLRHVYQHWCRGGVNRKHERTAADARCAIVTGVDSIYFQLAGEQPFRQPGRADDEALRRERDEMATFGRIAPHSLGALGQQQTQHIEEWSVVEEWHMLDASATGIHAAHPLNDQMERVNQRQLVAIKLPSATTFLVGNLRWSMVTDDARLHVGIMILPGRPEAVALRPADLSGGHEPYHPGFLLPAVAAVGSTACLIAPPGTFRAGRILEIVGGQYPRVRLNHLIDRGIDFDRVGFEPLV